MKITDVKAWVVEPQGSSWGSTMDRHWMFVRIDTDEGIHGWGEATSSPRGGSFLTAHAVLAMKEALVGEDPVNIEPLWHRLYRRYTYMGSRGLPTTAISGIDIALWDIRGKSLGMPIYDLLGASSGMRFGCMRTVGLWVVRLLMIIMLLRRKCGHQDMRR